ncbi:MAG: RidA family protein [Planctomycetes bacterium]|nr:RidA family protein [Planctomycetota bacterium]
MDPQVVSTPHAPAAIGPYSQALIAGDLVFCSGQIALRPDGTLEQGDVAAETRQVLTNLRAVLEAAGAGLGRVVKTTVFLRDMADFQAMNAVYAEFFPAPAPARSTVAVAGLPRGVRVEVEAVALRGALTG